MTNPNDKSWIDGGKMPGEYELARDAAADKRWAALRIMRKVWTWLEGFKAGADWRDGLPCPHCEALRAMHGGKEFLLRQQLEAERTESTKWRESNEAALTLLTAANVEIAELKQKLQDAWEEIDENDLRNDDP